MFSNYFNTALRNLWRNKGLGVLNIAGLAIGITCAVFIFLWVEDELNYDSAHTKKNVLYQVYQNQVSEQQTFTINATSGPLAQGIKEEIPGVMNTCRTTWPQSLLFSTGDKKIKQEGLYVDSSIFSMFTLPFTEGNQEQAFREAYALVITERMAHRFFGDGRPVVGKVLRAEAGNFVITGVIKDLPQNSTLQFEWLAPFQIHLQNNQWLQHWEYNGVQTFVELAPRADVAFINKQLSGFTLGKTTKRIGKPFLLSMNDWRLRSDFENGEVKGGRIQYVKLFSSIAWIILLIACINFMNLATARSAKRAREVGVRKVLGAEKGSLVKQFLCETIVMSFAAVCIAVVLVYLLAPSFNTLVEKHLTLDLSKPVHLFSLLAIGIICGVVAGSYPSFYLSSFNPIAVLKGLNGKEGSAVIIRKGLVVVQFAASVIFIIGTIIIYKQIQHVKNRPLGYNKDNLLQIELTEAMRKNYSALKQDLLSTGNVEGVAGSMLNVLYMGSTTSEFSWQGKDPNNQIILTQNWVNPEYIPTIGMTIKHGRNFYANTEQDSLSVIVNETLAKLIGPENVIGKTVTRGKKQFTIVGVVSNVIYDDLYGSGGPMIFLSYPEIFNYLYVRLKGTNLEQSVAKVNAIIKKYEPDYAADYTFVDDDFSKMFQNEMLTGRLSRLFALLAIIISCIGLFGLAAFTAEKRTKEIGIRKVLGASVSNIVNMLSKDFLKLVLIAAVIAFPISWWAMHQWLQDFAYRITISWWVFVVAAVIAMVIAFLTISFQAIKAAIANPVKNLRTE